MQWQMQPSTTTSMQPFSTVLVVQYFDKFGYLVLQGNYTITLKLFHTIGTIASNFTTNISVLNLPATTGTTSLSGVQIATIGTYILQATLSDTYNSNSKPYHLVPAICLPS